MEDDDDDEKENNYINKHIDSDKNIKINIKKKNSYEIKDEINNFDGVNSLKDLEDLDIDEDTNYFDKIKKSINDFSSKKLDPILALQKVFLRNHIEKKVEKLNLKQRYIEHKLSNLKRINTSFILLILILSTILTLTEASRKIFEVENAFLNFLPLILSTLVTFCSSLSKTFKYQESIEELIKCLEKCILTESELKKTREQLHFCNNYERFDKIKDNYMVNNYAMYIGCSMDINKNISMKNIGKIIKNINDIDIKIKKECYKKEEKINELNNKMIYLKNRNQMSTTNLDLIDKNSSVVSRSIDIDIND